uniref:Uncharacterized protein n=1 Tax=Tanacetum cinerariifolium TaxID=118510 RepID=A0A6L2LJH5_TANCI|nr:hypothetical protein [Tanacetum cinerariifolium]
MLNKHDYVPWSSHLLCYAKSKPSGKLLVNSIKNGPYVGWMIHETGDPNSVPLVAESSHEQTYDKLTDKEVKQMEADDKAIQTTLMGLPEDIYAAIASYDTTQEIWQIAQPGMNIGQDIQMQMVRGIANQNANQNGNDNVVAARAEGNSNGNNGIQIQAEEFNLMASVRDINEIKEVNANCILMANLHKVSTSGTQTVTPPIYDTHRNIAFGVQLQNICTRVPILTLGFDPLLLDFNTRKPRSRVKRHSEQLSCFAGRSKRTQRS